MVIKKWFDNLINKIDGETYYEAFEWIYDDLKRNIKRTIFSKKYWIFLGKAIRGERYIDYDYISWDFGSSLMDITKECCKIYLSKDHIVDLNFHKGHKEFLEKLVAIIDEYERMDQEDVEGKRTKIEDINFINEIKREGTEEEYEQYQEEISKQEERKRMQYRKFFDTLAYNSDEVRTMWW